MPPLLGNWITLNRAKMSFLVLIYFLVEVSIPFYLYVNMGYEKSLSVISVYGDSLVFSPTEFKNQNLKFNSLS